VVEPDSLDGLTLAQLADGERAVIRVVDGDDLIAKRLRDIGFWPGTEVMRVRTAPLGDPIVYSLRGFEMALRNDEAQRVLLDHADEAAP